MAVKQALKKGTRARNRQAQQLKANRAAQGQGLFSADSETRRKMRRARNGGTVQMSGDEVMQHAKGFQGQMDDISKQMIEMDKEIAGGNLKGIDLVAARRNRQGLQDSHDALNQQRRKYTKAFANDESISRDMTTGERWASAGGAIKDYYIGGTMGQSAARIGATTGGIVGLNMGMDYLNGGR